MPARRSVDSEGISGTEAATIWTRFEQVRNDWAAVSGAMPESADGEDAQWRMQLW
jgi:hypothetical protein